MTHTTDPTDPRLGRGPDTQPGPQNDAYLVDEGKGKFVRPVRRTYVHWTQADGSPVPAVVVDATGYRGCGVATTMSRAIAETYARDPKFYGSRTKTVSKHAAGRVGKKRAKRRNRRKP